MNRIVLFYRSALSLTLAAVFTAGANAGPTIDSIQPAQTKPAEHKTVHHAVRAHTRERAPVHRHVALVRHEHHPVRVRHIAKGHSVASPKVTAHVPTNRTLLRPIVVVGVGPHANVATIGAAMLLTKPGGTIQILPGTYNETVRINREVIIVGEGPRADIIVDSSQPCLEMLTHHAVVRNLTLRSHASELESNSSAVDVSSGDLILEDSDITSEGQACVAVHGKLASATLNRCIIHDGKKIGAFIYNGGTGMLNDCQLNNNMQDAVSVNFSSKATLTHCTMNQNQKSGVSLSDDSSVTMDNCDIVGCVGVGLVVDDGGALLARNCTVKNGRLQGLMLVGTGRAELDDCTLNDNLKGSTQITDASKLIAVRCNL